MKELLFSVFSLCIFSSAVTYLCPDGKGSTVRLIRALCSVCICAALISPLSTVVGDSPHINIDLPSTEADESSGEAVAAAVRRQIEKELEGRLETDFGILSPSLSLTLDLTDLSAMVIVCGELTGKGEGLTEGAEYISELLGCHVNVKEVL